MLLLSTCYTVTDSVHVILLLFLSTLYCYWLLSTFYGVTAALHVMLDLKVEVEVEVEVEMEVEMKGRWR